MWAEEASRFMQLFDECKNIEVVSVANILRNIESSHHEAVKMYLQGLPTHQQEVVQFAYKECEAWISEWTILHHLYKDLVDGIRGRLQIYKPIWDIYLRSQKSQSRGYAYDLDFKNVPKWDTNQIQQALQPCGEYKAMRQTIKQRLFHAFDHADFKKSYAKITNLLETMKYYITHVLPLTQTSQQ